jgi:hypothetical protein
MSRLDDELKVAFRRQEPPADFAARVLARLNEAPVAQVRPSLWQRLSATFAVPAWRYAAVTAVAVLLIIVGLALLRSHRTATVVDESSVAVKPGNEAGEKANDGTTTASEKMPASKDGVNAPDQSRQEVATTADPRVNKATRPRAGGSVQPVPHHPPVAATRAPQASAEAEAAKEKVLFALQITNDTLNDVQRAISDDRARDEKPEPVQNR